MAGAHRGRIDLRHKRRAQARQPLQRLQLEQLRLALRHGCAAGGARRSVRVAVGRAAVGREGPAVQVKGPVSELLVLVSHAITSI